MKKFEYSIIIPHKDIPELLSRCVKSIPHRDDLETIIVDDNSECELNCILSGIDNTNIKIIRNEKGGGAGAARNIGIKESHGKKVIFADADDFFTDEFNSALDKYKDTNYDIVYFKIVSKYCDTLEPSSRGDFINSMIDDADSEGSLDFLKFKRLEPWAKIYNRELFEKNGIWFDETPAANDLMFSILTASKAKNIAVDKMVIYCLTQRSGSLAYSITKEICLAKIKVIEKVNRFLINEGKGEYRINVFPYILNLNRVDKNLFIGELCKSFFSYRIDYVFGDFYKSVKTYLLTNK